MPMVDIRPAIGHHTLVIFCDDCGHTGHSDPVRYRAGQRFKCRECGAVTRTVRLIWREGYPPDNVVQLPAPMAPR